MLRVPFVSGTVVCFKLKLLNTLSVSIKVVHLGFDDTLDHVGVISNSFVNPDKLIDYCNVVIQVGFDSTWNHVRSLLNPDRLMDDCDVAIHDCLD